MIKIKDLKNLIKDLDDEMCVVISFNGCINSGEILSISKIMYTDTIDELFDLDDCGCVEENCGCKKYSEEEKNKKVLHLYSDRERFNINDALNKNK